MKANYFKVKEDLTIKKVNSLPIKYRISIILNILLAIGFFSTGMYVKFNPSTVITEYIHTRDTIHIGDVSLNDSSITAELVKNKCILPAVAVAQSRLETANYTSRVCRENKNLFGIKVHKCKYVQGELNNHASYKSYRDNIKCYIHVQNMYLRKIDGRYAEAKGYVNTLRTFK